MRGVQCRSATIAEPSTARTIAGMHTGCLAYPQKKRRPQPYPAQCLDKRWRALQEGKELGVNGVSGWVSQDAGEELIHFHLFQGHCPVAVLSEKGGRALSSLASLVCVTPIKACIQHGRMLLWHKARDPSWYAANPQYRLPSNAVLHPGGHFMSCTVLIVSVLQDLWFKIYCILHYEGKGARARLHAA